MIETSFGWPLGLPLAWAQVRKLADSRRGRCILCSSSSKISIRPISEVGISPARYGRGWGSGSPRRRRHHVRHCGGGGRSHASAGRPMTVSPYATPPAMLSSDSRSARGSVNLRTGANPKLNAAVRMGRAAVRARMKGRACQGLGRRGYAHRSSTTDLERESKSAFLPKKNCNRQQTTTRTPAPPLIRNASAKRSRPGPGSPRSRPGRKCLRSCNKWTILRRPRP
jgi:hypothetical protein